MFAKLVGEGFEKPGGDQDLPIDINYGKVVEWVMDRKVVSGDWKKKLEAIQSKAAEEAKLLPHGFLTGMGSGLMQNDYEDGGMSYFQDVEILSKLKETAERNVIGGLKGSAGRWEKIVKAYESSMLHVAEGGLILSRNVDYEIPFLKKQVAKNQQLIEDLDRKSADLIKSASVHATRFQEECEKQQVDSSAVKKDALALDAAILLRGRNLPGLVEDFVHMLGSSDLLESIKYYEDFATSHSPQVDSSEMLKALKEVIGKKSKEPDASMVESWIDVFEPEVANHESAITKELDTSIINGDASIEISWDNLEMEVGPSVIESEGDTKGDISWDIDISGAGEETQVVWDEGQPQMNGSDATSSVTCNNAKMAIMDVLQSCSKESRRMAIDMKYRNQVINDLLELKAFLGQRLKETQVSQDSVVTAHNFDFSTMKDMQSSISEAARKIQSNDITALDSVITRRGNRDRIAKSVIQLSGKEQKNITAARDLGKRKESLQRQLVSDSAKLSALVRETQIIKSAVEKCLGNKIQRKINVQGSIHAALQ
eukprot:jgi/Picsp_1/295/NSC_00294-R1_cdk5rap3-like protein